VIPHFQRIATTDGILSRLVSELERVLFEFTRREDNDSVIVDTTAIATGASGTTLTHGLGRTPTGWQIVSPDANATVWELSKNTSQLVLRASAAVNVKVKVW